MKMALLKLQQIRSDGVGYIDHRDLYFGKFNYRARVHMIGAYLCSYATKKEDFEKRLIIELPFKIDSLLKIKQSQRYADTLKK